MPSLAFVFLLVFLVIYSAPVFLLRRKQFARAQDYVVAAAWTPPGVLQNASIAYALRLALFAPAFVWGARGDLLPAIAFAAAAGLGIFLLYVLRRPLRDFLQAALKRDQSITVHAFIAGLHDDDRRVRLLAAGLTLIALSGLLIAEAVGLTAVLKPIQPGSAGWAYGVVGAMLVAAPLYAMPSGNSAVMHAAQAQLGTAYLGLFGAAAFLLYLLLAAFPPMPPHGTLAIAGAAVICIAVLAYRRSRYVDTSAITVATDDEGTAPVEPRASRLLRRFNKVLNPFLSALLVTTAVFALMGLFTIGTDRVMRDAAMALRQPTGTTGVELATLILLPLCYPLVDVSNWQRLAAFEIDGPTDQDRTAGLRRIIRTYALETALLVLFVAMVSAIAAMATATRGGADIVQSVITRLAFQQNLIAAGALAFLLIGMIAIAFSTMIALFSAGLCTLHADLLPTLSRQRTALEQPGRSLESAGLGPIEPRRMMAVGLLFFLVIAIGFAVTETLLTDRIISRSYLAVLIALACCQLSFAPLVLGSIIGRRRGASGAVGPQWALAILGIGTGVGVGAVVIHLATGNEAWLWAAVPACLGCGALLAAIAPRWPGKAVEKL